MRPPRIAILVLFLAASLFLFCRSVVSLHRSSQAATPLGPHRTTAFSSFLSFTTPFTLFPPNAAISLTDDNSTFFPARPAAFGPPLPATGLSGQLWIGSGFADENLPDGEGEGELGCGDLPGYEDGSTIIGLKGTTIGLSAKTKVATPAVKNLPRRANLPKDSAVDPAVHEGTKEKDKKGPVDDGTDDYLHQGLVAKSPGYEMTTVTSSHADIQSIQETAEITGKVVLLSRGGCGFLEKVKWAQRRGAVGVIVGDNQKGGPLIQMFARGDTSNITIPAIFTSRTTAHLLSSLMQPGSFIEDIIDEHGNPTLKVQQSDKAWKNKQTKAQTTTTPYMTKPTDEPKSGKSKVTRMASSTAADGAGSKRQQSRSWLARFFGISGNSKPAAEHSRPPSSGQHDWVLVDDWSDEKDKVIRSGLEKATKKGKAAATSTRASGDGFQIGVQDWRDPDLVDVPGTDATKSPANGKDAKAAEKSTTGSSKEVASQPGKEPNKKSDKVKDANGPKGGSITPGSGQYPSKEKQASSSKSGSQEGGSPGLISKLFGDEDAEASKTDPAHKPIYTPLTKEPEPKEPVHEGLWVTITPTGSTAPFFDTLLVLVVSPLITLTVVYALLILRAKIRRRRWRAPKSVVERLPVRTYHTVASSPTHTPRLPSPTSSSPTTPLLQSPPRPRPRSRTTTGVPDAEDLLRVDSALQPAQSPTRSPRPGEKESQWKKYMGRQVECVVCLEEYVDGISRVMSLPCGHEFHAECITPWLTTRRRTCPICKGDVVRSLARGSPSSPRYEPYRDDSDDDDDDVEPEASGSGRRSPIPQDIDVEQGILSPTPRRDPRRAGRGDGWLGMLSSSFGTNASASSSRSRAAEEDRDR
ncbi:E3 ubiquitin-protein ligase RNF13 [Cytospora mali]|uniref:E3 ubiquitin-protein ligase RNF13 n=1 Tax=Cytospora mali TaxID=578113 RepID=A0A194UZJ1_CYTMA|nr:E3 ubiquitin-protein ligase RNF13 [Valsa mali var. pyri (nom. inval.)]